MKRLSLFLGGILLASAAQAEKVEVLHWWTSGGEAAALNVLKKDLESQGVTWNDMPVAGGGGGNAMTVLRARVTAGNAPTAVQMLGFDIVDWAREGALANLNTLAAEENWDDVVPKALQRFSKHEGKWIAVPVNVHSTNWVWANKAILDEVGISTPPNDWNGLMAMAEKIKKAGYIPLAHGGQPWQEATIFDSVILATGGLDFYKKAFIALDMKVIKSATMRKAFERMATLRGLVDKNFSGRDWNIATNMVINKKAGFQIMGDWAKGEFINAGKIPGQDFLCFRVPGTQGVVPFNSDQFAMFSIQSSDQAAQKKLAKAIMNPRFQSAFNVVKGSVPARVDVSDRDFDACGKKGMKELAAANRKGSLVGSLAHGHAVPAAIKNAIYDVITAHFNGEYSSAVAVQELANAIAAAQ